jgi:leader peptidase (prepilin peptidase)/N-methyltransferase
VTPAAAWALQQFLALIFGAVVGSFLNVVIIRLPEGRSVVRPGSACGACGRPVRWFDNVPVLAYFWLRGRCRDCGTRLSPQYPLVEAGTALLSWLALRRFGLGLDYAIAFAFLASLVAISGVDLKIRIIPDAISLPGTLLALVVSPWSGFTTPVDALVGCFSGIGSLFLIAWAYEVIRDREGMGFGDVKLLGMIGATLGWQALPATLLLASLAGAAVGIGMVLASGRRDLALPIPFGPFLALGAMVSLFFSDWLGPLRLGG